MKGIWLGALGKPKARENMKFGNIGGGRRRGGWKGRRWPGHVGRGVLLRRVGLYLVQEKAAREF